MTNPQNLFSLDMAKVAQGKCGIPYCRNTRLKGRNICSKHKHQRRKVADPVGYIYDIKKQRAKERDIEFDLTIDQFRKFCKETGYHNLCGRAAEKMSIDRIDSSRGYSFDNIRMITVSENSAKGNRDSAPF